MIGDLEGYGGRLVRGSSLCPTGTYVLQKYPAAGEGTPFRLGVRDDVKLSDHSCYTTWIA